MMVRRGRPVDIGAILLSLAILLPAGSPLAQEIDVSGYGEAELSGFPYTPLFDRQSNQRVQPSVAAQLELSADLDDRNTVYARLFGRYDQVESVRSKVDAREAHWTYYGDAFSLRAGFLTEFWGRLEQENIVDIVNQRDVVEDFKLDEKLGQPGLKLSIPVHFGSIDLYALTYSRGRPFPGDDGRYQLALPIDEPGQFDSSLNEWHPQFAARVQAFVDSFEFALSHFYGHSREPRLRPVFDGPRVTALKAEYDLINQTGFEAQYVGFGSVFKFEGIYRRGFRDNSIGFGIGVEHELVGVFGTSISVTPYLEFYYDNRNDTEPLTPFEHDIYVGTRIALNDFAGTVIQAQATIDTESGATLYTLETERRFLENWRLLASLDIIGHTNDDDALDTFRDDDRLMLRVRRFF